MFGAGKFDEHATRIREATDADGVIVMVLGGKLGSGFSVQAPLPIQAMLPELLTDLAANIKRDLIAMGIRGA